MEHLYHTPLPHKIQETLRKKGGKGIRAKGQGRVLWDVFFWVWQGPWTYRLTAVVDASTGSKLSTKQLGEEGTHEPQLPD